MTCITYKKKCISAGIQRKTNPQYLVASNSLCVEVKPKKTYPSEKVQGLNVISFVIGVCSVLYPGGVLVVCKSRELYEQTHTTKYNLQQLVGPIQDYL